MKTTEKEREGIELVEAACLKSFAEAEQMVFPAYE